MRPCTTTCAPSSLCGFNSTGFMSVVGATPQARACSAWARPISPPSAVTAALLDMFRSEEHTSELQSLMRISYAVFCLKKKRYQQIQQFQDLSIPDVHYLQ